MKAPYRVHLQSESQMVISSNLSLIPYPKDNYALQPVNSQMMLPDQDTGRHGPGTGRQAMNRYDLTHRPTIRYHYIYTDDQNLTYSPNRCMESSKADHLGSRVDLYI